MGRENPGMKVLQGLIFRERGLWGVIPVSSNLRAFLLEKGLDPEGRVGKIYGLSSRQGNIS